MTRPIFSTDNSQGEGLGVLPGHSGIKLNAARRESVPAPGETFYWELEDGTGFFELEDGTGLFLLEEAP